MPSPRWGAMASAAALTAALTGSFVIPSSPAHAACPAASTGSVARAPEPAGDDKFVFYGSGLGHGLGMSQYGSQGAAELGCSSAQILTTYYRGAQLVQRTMPDEVGVWMLNQGTDSTLRLEPDGTRSVRVRWYWNGQVLGTQREGKTWTVQIRKGRIELRNASGGLEWAKTNPAKPLRARHSGVLTHLHTNDGDDRVIDLSNMWDFTEFRHEGSRLDVQQRFVDNGKGTAVDKYLYGLGEVFAYWPAAALEAQAVAARTFLVRVDRVLRPGDSDQRYQGYVPLWSASSAAWRRGVDATSQTILVDGGGRAIDAMYSSSMAGWTESNRYVFGTPSVPHLQPVDDSAWANASDDPKKAWARSFTNAELASRLGFDWIRSISVADRGSADRAAGVVVTGNVGGGRVTRSLTGWDVRQWLGLPSPGFVVVTR